MNEVMREFKAYWQLADRTIEGATKEQLAETARILALQAAHYARRYGELPLPELQKLLTATQIDTEQLMVLRDSTEGLVGVLATVSEIGDESEYPMQ
jgi:acetyl-CoA acetyltransferase